MSGIEKWEAVGKWVYVKGKPRTFENLICECDSVTTRAGGIRQEAHAQIFAEMPELIELLIDAHNALRDCQGNPWVAASIIDLIEKLPVHQLGELPPIMGR